jgi:hypothetical protein
LGSKVREQLGQLRWRGRAAEDVEVRAHERRVGAVLGQPSREAAIRVAHALGRGGVERGDRHVEGVDHGALLARELGEGVAVGDDQLNAAADDIVETSVPARSGQLVLLAASLVRGGRTDAS